MEGKRKLNIISIILLLYSFDVNIFYDNRHQTYINLYTRWF